MTVRETRTYQLTNLDTADRIHFDRCVPVLIDRHKSVRPVNTKQDFYRRFQDGEFGNRGPVWETVKAWKRAGSPAPCMIRCRVPDGTNYTRVPKHQIELKFNLAKQRGHGPTINLQCPEHLKILTGEAFRSHRGLEFAGSDDPDTDQRRSTRRPGNMIAVHGLRAEQLLRQAMWPRDWEWFCHLLDAYDGHVVEFTSLSRHWGVLPGMNTIIWEVRNY